MLVITNLQLFNFLLFAVTQPVPLYVFINFFSQIVWSFDFVYILGTDSNMQQAVALDEEVPVKNCKQIELVV